MGVGDEELPDLPKGLAEKLALAWWLRRYTTLPRKRIARRLHMGHENRVTLAVRQVSGARRGRLAQVRKALEKLAAKLRTP